MKKKRRKQNKAWNIIPIAAVTVFILALVLKIWTPDALRTHPDGGTPDGSEITETKGPETTETPETPHTPETPGDGIQDISGSGSESPSQDTEDPSDLPQEPVDEPDIPTPPNTPTEPDEPSDNEEDHSSVWSLILVNPTHYLPDGYEIELETVQGKYQMDSRAAEKAREMIAAAKEDGVTLQVCSAYRSHQKQTSNFNAKLQSYLDKGWSYDEAYAKTATIIAVPGTSEHETGLALDIVTPSYQVLDAGYAETDAAKWLLENAADYGFILRFPKDKQDITKIIFEPWHYRYVGTEYSSLIMDSGLCLEEWLGEVD